jgi:hypothetical protein
LGLVFLLGGKEVCLIAGSARSQIKSAPNEKNVRVTKLNSRVKGRNPRTKREQPRGTSLWGAGFFVCARHGNYLGGESPLWGYTSTNH